VGAEQPKKWQVVVRFTANEIEALDAMQKAHGYENRSQTLRALVRGGFAGANKKKGGVR
jgi:metal-responsive CopG/Arc/MetJ family transcriptional regulator